MSNEYGRILLQQIEEERLRRQRQRAEERGLPVPPEKALKLVAPYSGAPETADNAGHAMPVSTSTTESYVAPSTAPNVLSEPQQQVTHGSMNKQCH